MKSKKNKNSFDGIVLLPVIELLIILVSKLMKILEDAISKATSYSKCRSDNIDLKTIDRNSINNKKSTTDEDFIGYSTSRHCLIHKDDISKKEHTGILGSSGAGKTSLVNVLISNDLSQNKSVLRLDPKDDIENMNDFINLCKIHNKKYLIFSENYNGPNNLLLNPIKDGTHTNIKERIMDSFSWSEEHYFVLCDYACKETVKNLISNGETVSYSKVLNYLLENSGTVKEKKKFLRNEINGLITRLDNLVDSPFGDKLIDSGYSINDVWSDDISVYIGTPILGYPKLAKTLYDVILRDFYFTVYNSFKTLGRKDSLKPFAVVLEEFSSGVDEAFINLLNKARSAKFEITFDLQSSSDIKTISPDLFNQIFENTANWFILKQRMDNHADIISRSIGTILTEKLTRKVDEGEETLTGSTREVDQLIVHPNIIKNLNKGQVVLLRQFPTKVDLINLRYIDPKILNENALFLEKNNLITPYFHKHKLTDSVQISDEIAESGLEI
ncbi:MAG: helicase HerA domain-containing protein [Bacteriovoracaceae bacterium]